MGNHRHKRHASRAVAAHDLMAAANQATSAMLRLLSDWPLYELRDRAEQLAEGITILMAGESHQVRLLAITAVLQALTDEMREALYGRPQCRAAARLQRRGR